MSKYNYSQNKFCRCGKIITNVSKYCASCAAKNRVKKSINNPAYIDGRTLKKYFCLDCGKVVSGYKVIRCRNCNIKNYHKTGIFNTKGKNNPNYGKKGELNINYIDGRCTKEYYCIICKEKICYQTWKYGKKLCISCSRKLNWQDKKYRNTVVKNVLKGLKISPNKPETLLIKLFKQLRLNFKYIGNGIKIIGGFSPDFINIKNKKIIEFFGCYWHKCKTCGFGERKIQPKDVGRLHEYHKAGYQTLIVWEHELKDLNKLIVKILNFN